MSDIASVFKVLIFAADPNDHARLQLSREMRKIEECLSKSELRDWFAVVHSLAARVDDLQHRIRTVGPAVVHFSGHGAGAGGLMFQEDDGLGRAVLTDALADLFKIFKDTVQLVVLNACYSEEQAQAIWAHVPFVVGMKQAIEDKTAADFTVGFYESLFNGDPPDRAFEFGRNRVQLESLPASVKAALADRNALPDGEAPAERLPEHLRPVLLARPGAVWPFTAVLAAGRPGGERGEAEAVRDHPHVAPNTAAQLKPRPRKWARVALIAAGALAVVASSGLLVFPGLWRTPGGSLATSSSEVGKPDTVTQPGPPPEKAFKMVELDDSAKSVSGTKPPPPPPTADALTGFLNAATFGKKVDETGEGTLGKTGRLKEASQGKCRVLSVTGPTGPTDQPAFSFTVELRAEYKSNAFLGFGETSRPEEHDVLVNYRFDIVKRSGSYEAVRANGSDPRFLGRTEAASGSLDHDAVVIPVQAFDERVLGKLPKP